MVKTIPWVCFRRPSLPKNRDRITGSRPLLPTRLTSTSRLSPFASSEQACEQYSSAVGDVVANYPRLSGHKEKFSFCVAANYLQAAPRGGFSSCDAANYPQLSGEKDDVSSCFSSKLSIAIFFESHFFKLRRSKLSSCSATSYL